MVFLCIQYRYIYFREFYLYIHIHVHVHTQEFFHYIIYSGGTFSQVESFNFTRSSRNSCLNITLPLSELDPLSDTEFSADIQLPMDPVFHLGPVSSATITVEAIEGQKTIYTCICTCKCTAHWVTSIFTSRPVCDIHVRMAKGVVVH